jgi:hypothetical protein
MFTHNRSPNIFQGPPKKAEVELRFDEAFSNVSETMDVYATSVANLMSFILRSHTN